MASDLLQPNVLPNAVPVVLFSLPDVGLSPAALEAIAVLEHGGTKVEVAQVDITDSNAVDHLFQEIATSGQPLRGILQMAGAWDDAPLAKLGRERFESVLAPKLQGTLNLHEASQSCNLDFFLLFSSAASLLGSAGQGNYAAANAFLDGFAFHRRARGQTALSINWGVWSEIGVAARLDVESRLAQLGMSPLPPEIGLNIMEALASRNAAQVAVMRVDWALYAGNFTDLPPFLSQLTGEASAVPPPAAVHFDMMAFNAASTNDQHFIVIDFLRTQLAKVLGTGSDRIEPEKALNTTGMDSLMAVGLRNQIKNGTGVDIPIIDFLEGSTLTDLARHVLAELQSESEPQKTSAETNDWLEVEI